VRGLGNIDSRTQVLLFESMEIRAICSAPSSANREAHARRSIETAFPMTTLTDRELEILIGLRTNWRELYSKELARLVNDDTKRAVDRLRMPCDPAFLKTQRGTHIFDDPD
jgi:hypothetical protein